MLPAFVTIFLLSLLDHQERQCRLLVPLPLVIMFTVQGNTTLIVAEAGEDLLTLLRHAVPLKFTEYA